MKYVISLGGSVIVPNDIDINYLKKFNEIIKKYSRNNKFIIITGGGSIARKYIKPLKKAHLDVKTIGLIGIATTRLNADLVKSIMKIKTNPRNNKDIINLIKKDSIVVTGALNFLPDTTTDGICAQIAHEIKADLFINITHIKGLFDKNPLVYKDAKFISKISFDNFDKMVNKMKFRSGQHYILDQKAAQIIKKYKIKTIIIGNNIKNLNNILSKKKFIGTVINY